MTASLTLHEIFEETRTLLRQSATSQGKILVSPEVAALLERAGPSHPAFTAPDLEALAGCVASCTRCALHQGRTQTVFGAGKPRAEIVFVGEAPGEEEDRRGEPFVGRAGQLLTDIIVKGMKLRREDVYICNVLKCRPPQNRDPAPGEVRECEPFLLRQLQLIQPRVICALGKHAGQTLLKTDASTGQMRGKWHDYHGIPLRVTYHPAYLLRREEEKRKAWDDIKEVMKLLAQAPAAAR